MYMYMQLLCIFSAHVHIHMCINSIEYTVELQGCYCLIFVLQFFVQFCTVAMSSGLVDRQTDSGGLVCLWTAGIFQL